MFTDMVGYTALMQKDEDEARKLIERHRAHMKPFVEKHGGEIIQYVGDGTFCRFDSAIEAVNSALEIQKVLEMEPEINLRIGIHIGDVVVKGDEVYGDGVNVASRIEPLAESGGICVSGQVYDNIKNQPEMETVFLGEKNLKNITGPIMVHRIVLRSEEDAAPSRSGYSAIQKPAASKWIGIGLVVVLIMVSAFWWWSSRQPSAIQPGQIRSIAILPLDNLMGDPEQDYFVDGMHEALITELGKIGALRVISRTSVLGYRDNPKPIPVIARELGVDALVEGSVLLVDDRVRITAQLIGTDPERHLWTNSYDRDLQSVLALHSDVARDIAKQIKAVLTPEKPASEQRPVNQKAYDSYLKGRYEIDHFTVAPIKRAIAHFQESIRIDSAYAPAHAGLSTAYILLSQPLKGMDRHEGMPLARAAAERALELNYELSEAHAALGGVHFFYEWDWEAAERELRIAVELNPSSVWGRKILGFFLAVMGRSSEAIPELEMALELDPLSLQTRVIVAEGFYQTRKFERAITEYRNILELAPGFGRARWLLAMSYEALGRFEEAIENYAEGRLRADSSAATLKDIEDLRIAYANRGSIGYWEWRFERPGRRGDFRRAEALAALGRVDELMALLEEWYEKRVGNMPFLRSPQYDPVRHEPRFQELLRRMNLSE